MIPEGHSQIKKLGKKEVLVSLLAPIVQELKPYTLIFQS